MTIGLIDQLNDMLPSRFHLARLYVHYMAVHVFMANHCVAMSVLLVT